jgi:ATP-dependent Zn protease
MLLKVWFKLVVVVLLGSLLTLLFDFDVLNALHWISLFVIATTIALTILVYLERPKKQNIKKLEQTYAKFLQQKDKQIEELQKKTDVMFKTAFKRSEADIELAELKRKLEEQTKN